MTFNKIAHHIILNNIEQDIRSGELNFSEIARKHQVASYVVTDVYNWLCECELDD